MLVDLLTTEEDLEGLMLAEYPGEISGEISREQITKIGEDVINVYSFLGLNYNELSYFLIVFFDKSYEFKIFEHQTKRLIEDNNSFSEPFYLN